MYSNGIESFKCFQTIFYSFNFSQTPTTNKSHLIKKRRTVFVCKEICSSTEVYEILFHLNSNYACGLVILYIMHTVRRALNELNLEYLRAYVIFRHKFSSVQMGVYLKQKKKKK